MNANAQEFSASIMHHQQHDSIIVIPLLYTTKPGDYQYEVIASKQDSVGKSSIHQAGSVSIPDGVMKPVTRIELGYEISGTYSIRFRVFDSGGVLAETQLDVPHD